MVLTLRVESRDGRDMGTFALDDNATAADLKTAFQAKFKKYPPEQQYFTKDNKADPKDKLVVRGSKSLRELGLADGDVLTFKNLGLQVGYRTVFYVEYAGPIAVHAAFYLLQSLFYGKSFEHTNTQKLAFAMVVFHYIKRELETAFVHQFSNDTMPVFNIFKNSFHYWGLGGAFIAYFLYHPAYLAPFADRDGFSPLTILGVVVFLICEIGNLLAHRTLSNLRPPGTKVRAIPYGGLFALVACPNYTFEVGAWTAFCLITNTLTGYLFLLVSTAQMALWAAKKHSQYKAEFGETYKSLRRKKMFPFLW